MDRVLVDPIGCHIGKRDRSKLDGPVGKLCAEKNIEFVRARSSIQAALAVPSTIS